MVEFDYKCPFNTGFTQYDCIRSHQFSDYLSGATLAHSHLTSETMLSNRSSLPLCQVSMFSTSPMSTKCDRALLLCEHSLRSKLSYLGKRSEPRENARARGFAARSRVLARLVSLAQIGELARGLVRTWNLTETVYSSHTRYFSD